MSRFDLIVVGYLSLDEIVCPSGHYRDVPGGAAYYAAAGAALAGASVLLAARAGSDFPTSALDALRSAGIELDVIRDTGPTRRSRLHDPTGSDRTSPHHHEAVWWEATHRLVPPVPRDAATACLFTAMPAPVLALQLNEAPPGTITIADTSTGYARSEPQAILALLPRLTCFAPSREETRLLLPALDDDAALETLASRVPLAIQKRGRDGVALRRGNATLHAPSRASTIVDTTGAGDSLVGAVAAGLARNASDAELLASGASVAARAVSGIGAAGLFEAMETTRS